MDARGKVAAFHGQWNLEIAVVDGDNGAEGGREEGGGLSGDVWVCAASGR